MFYSEYDMFYRIPCMPSYGYMGYGSKVTYKKLEYALSLVKKAVEGEKEDELFYDYLISVAPTKEEKDMIKSIRNDERKHFKMFRKIYKDFTGKDIKLSDKVTFKKPKSYIKGIKKALFGELSAVEKYRDIRAGLSYRYYRDMVFEIITDEFKHSGKYNYILNINCCNMNMNYNDKVEIDSISNGWILY
ncbi:hypothetical protein CLPU_11c01030 [Gottschalkia purinilytica]|uniref:Rubrerythrin diiron-binding domain-containing protein n=1 Tax=Gottschalkia purinilytica TaxID=1503 RepID=A0A0L0W8R3_GOTPU|nr:ferritin-like domain-containing protein [Gottschalkia purinilytica]KNF07934.1 hypothetical protein CLPU_11c01030 [Gottschalkia purinilytica]